MTEDEVTCWIDNEEVSCNTWEPISKEEADQIESQLDFLSLYGE